MRTIGHGYRPHHIRLMVLNSMKGQEVRDIVKAIASGQQIPPEKETPHLTEITRRSAVALGEHMSGIKEHSGDETFYAKMLHDHFVL